MGREIDWTRGATRGIFLRVDQAMGTIELELFCWNTVMHNPATPELFRQHWYGPLAEDLVEVCTGLGLKDDCGRLLSGWFEVEWLVRGQTFGIGLSPWSR